MLHGIIPAPPFPLSEHSAPRHDEAQIDSQQDRALRGAPDLAADRRAAALRMSAAPYSFIKGAT